MPNNSKEGSSEALECFDCGIEIEVESVKVNDNYLCSHCLGDFIQTHGIAVLKNE